MLISVGLLGYLIYLADVDKILSSLRQADLTYFGFALIIFLIALFLLTLRWQILLKKSDIQPGYSRLLVFYFIGYFFNNFLPTAIGGDVSRAYYVARISGDQAASIGAILLERIMGILATMTLASFAMIWAIEYFNSSLIIVLTAAVMGVVVFALINLFNPFMFRFTSNILSKITFLHLGEKIHGVLATMHSYREAKMIIFAAFLLSLTCQSLWILMNYILVLALGIEEVSLGYLFLVVPITFVMSMVPSINGLGVRDYGYKELLARVGVMPAEALSLSFLNTMVPMLMSLVGGLFLIFYRNKIPAAVPQNSSTSSE